MPLDIVPTSGCECTHIHILRSLSLPFSIHILRSLSLLFSSAHHIYGPPHSACPLQDPNSMVNIASGEKFRSTSGDKLSMKLLLDTKVHRVLSTSSSRSSPCRSAPSSSSSPMAGSMGNLYSSVNKLDDTYVCRDDTKNVLLTPAGGWDTGKLLQLPEPEHAVGVLYRCNNNCRNYASVRGLLCTNCHRSMETLMQPLVDESEGGSDGGGVPRAAGAGFVLGIVTYTMMHDLKVSPMSSISRITLLNTFGVTDIRSLQEKTVQLGYAEGLEILKASLQSKTVLADVFLAKKRPGGLN
ncbi:hypothetical protein VPH35_139294 [Triticum aestivum]|uniref:Uncharacterized protein n=1 Tax=Aegilops tauschii TaxID=37682 RepID=M8B7V3_AEGTA